MAEAALGKISSRPKLEETQPTARREKVKRAKKKRREVISESRPSEDPVRGFREG
jgi:hypothetical protein